MCKNFLSLEKYLEIGFFICENSNMVPYENFLKNKVSCIHGNDINNTGYRHINFQFTSDSGYVTILFCEYREVDIVTVSLTGLTTTLSSTSVKVSKIHEFIPIVDLVQAVISYEQRYRVKFTLFKDFETLGAYDILIVSGNAYNLTIDLAES